MSVAIKNLGAGSLNSTALATAFPQTGKSWIVKSIIISNRDSVPRALNVWITNGATIASAGGTAGTGYVAPEGMMVAAFSTVIIDAEITLQNPTGGPVQTLNFQAVVAPAAMDIVLNGLERDI